MHVERYEKIFMALTLVVLLAALAAIGVGVFAAEVHLPSPSGRIDPKAIRQTPPFDQPGLREVAPGEYEAVIIARAWAFEPNEIRVPRGSIVRFRVASADVIHGFLIENTNVNVMVIPGQVAEVTARFERPGEYVFLCHEYCGFGHHQMFGKVIVE